MNLFLVTHLIQVEQGSPPIQLKAVFFCAEMPPFPNEQGSSLQNTKQEGGWYHIKVPSVLTIFCFKLNICYFGFVVLTGPNDMA